MSQVVVAMRGIRAIAVNSFREAIRSKVLGTLVFFTVILCAGAALMGQLSVNEERRVTIDIAIFLSTLFSVVIAIYTMVTSLHTELERRTIYTILSKPITRWQFLLGKYTGVVAVLGVVTFGMYLLSAFLLAVQGFDVPTQLQFAFLGIFLQTAIVTAVALTFASFSTPLLTGMFTASVFLVGNWLSLIEDVKPYLRPIFGENTESVIGIAWVIVPNLEQLNVAESVTHLAVVPGSYVAHAVAYTCTEVAVLLTIASLLFRRRDFA